MTLDLAYYKPMSQKHLEYLQKLNLSPVDKRHLAF